ncbi:MAG TPA: hypothetical protein VGH79_02585 [Gaiellaceae bacterium]
MTAAEREGGWVEFACARHGVVVETVWRATVTCGCGCRTRRLVDGLPMSLRDLKRRFG